MHYGHLSLCIYTACFIYQHPIFMQSSVTGCIIFLGSYICYAVAMHAYLPVFHKQVEWFSKTGSRLWETSEQYSFLHKTTVVLLTTGLLWCHQNSHDPYLVCTDHNKHCVCLDIVNLLYMNDKSTKWVKFLTQNILPYFDTSVDSKVESHLTFLHNLVLNKLLILVHVFSPLYQCHMSQNMNSNHSTFPDTFS